MSGDLQQATERVVGAFKGIKIVDSGESFTVFSGDYNEPMWGDYRGCEMAKIRYNSCREDSKERALAMAWAVVNYCAENPINPEA